MTRFMAFWIITQPQRLTQVSTDYTDEICVICGLICFGR